MKQQFERSPSESYFWPVVLAVVLHVLIFAMLFVSWAFAPELPPSKPIVQATLYQLKSKSQATTQTNQKIAGEAKKTASKQYEVEQLEQKKLEQRNSSNKSWNSSRSLLRKRRNKRRLTRLERPRPRKPPRRKRPMKPRKLPRPRPPNRRSRLT